MKTKIILLLFVVVFISSAILLYMVINTFKKDKISYVYDVITSETQSLARQLQSEIDSLHLLVSTTTKNENDKQDFNDLNTIQYFSVIQFNGLTTEILAEKSKNKFVKKSQNINQALELSKKLNQLEQKTFFSNDSLIYEVSLSQISPNRVVVILAFESEIQSIISEKSSGDQSAFLLDQNMNILFGQNDVLQSFRRFIDRNSSQNFEDSRTGLIHSDSNEPWIYSMSRIAGTDLQILNLVSEKKAFSVMKTIYFKSLISFILILSLVVIIGIISATYLTDKLNQLTTATKKVAAGELDTEIQVTGQDEITSLSTDFNQMVRQIKKLMGETAEQARMENELKTAQLVQENLFPPSEHNYQNCSVIGYCKPASECGGDWWFHAEDNQNVNIMIADATGHGVPAALMTSAIKSAFILTAKLNLSSVETITKINEALCEVGRNKVMMTAFYIRINKKTNLAEYINASHEAPFILDLNLEQIQKDQLIFLNENSSARLGQSPDTLYQKSEIQLSQKQRLFLYTDGIFDLKNNEMKKLTERSFYKNVIELANQKTNFTAYSDDIKSFIFDYHKQKTLDDDVTLCHIEII